MIRNYILVTLRNLRKNSIYSLINIGGLAIGITCSILILLWVHDELSFDMFHSKADRLYRLRSNVTYDGKINTWGASPLPAYEVLKTEDNRIVNTAIIDWGGEHLLTVGEKGIRKQGNYVSEEFLSMFDFPLLKGNRKTVVSDPGSIVLSEATAKALFGDEDPMDKMVRVDNRYDQKVAGVMANVPANSSFHFDFVLPWKLYENEPWIKNNKNSWDSYSSDIFVELSSSDAQGAVEDVIRDLHARHKPDDAKHEFFLYPLTQWRLYTRFENGVVTGGGIDYVILFSIIAAFVLFMACINFMNLATARSERRAREVGIRKSVGSRKYELITQFMGESVFIAFLAFALAMLLTLLALPFYNDLVQKQLGIDFTSPTFWILAVSLIFLTGIISGSYPAFYLSSFQPIQVLKGKIKVGKSASTPRKVLVTLQFGFSILLIIGTLVIYRQIQHVKNRDIGYNKENLITIKPSDDIQKNYRAIKNDLLQSGVVAAVTKCNNAITEMNNYSFLNFPGKPDNARVLFTNLGTEFDYTKTMGIKVLMGRDFSEDYKTDSSAVIINKAALDVMGLKDPIGQQLSLLDGEKLQLIGVVENSIMTSPYEAVYPMFIQFDPNWANTVTIRLAKTNDVKETLKKVEAVFKKYSPAYPFEFSFVDQEFQKKYSEIDLMGKLANLFTFLALLITGLGLFGLAAFTAEQRTKEIGIRKVLGANVGSLVALIAKDFSRLVIFAFILSSPIAWWLLNNFLEKYQYRIEIPLWIFPLTGITALIFAIGIVSTQALRAAHSDPVKSLRSE
jgi:putative ABC transport system permease protein